MIDLLSIGDTTTDVFLDIDEEEIRVRDENSDGVDDLIMDIGSKIPIKTLNKVMGVGNAANAAIGAARLGLSSAIYTQVGDDVDGQEAKRIFEGEGVSVDFVQVSERVKTNFSAVINVEAERTILVYHEDRTYGLPEGLPEVGVVYYTSLGKGHDVLHAQVPEFCAKVGARLVFQPGSHQLREGFDVLRPIVSRSDVVLMNKQEAQVLLGMKDAEVSGLISKFLEHGAKTVAITDGENGSFAGNGDGVWHCKPYPVEVVEVTGAGDAFSVGFAAGLYKGMSIGESLEQGNVNAAGVLRFIGAREGLLRADEVVEWRKREGWGAEKIK